MPKSLTNEEKEEILLKSDRYVEAYNNFCNNLTTQN